MTEWVKVLQSSELIEGKLYRVNAKGDDIVIGVLGGKPFAVENVCSHQEYPLHDGSLTPEGDLKCRYHGAKFNPFTGDAVSCTSTFPIHAFKIEIRADGVYVQV